MFCWKKGETVPNTETLKLLSNAIDDEILGREKDGTLNEEYCKWC